MMLNSNELIGFGGRYDASPTYTAAGVTQSSDNLTTYTFNNLNIGNDYPGRVLIVVVFAKTLSDDQTLGLNSLVVNGGVNGAVHNNNVQGSFVGEIDGKFKLNIYSVSNISGTTANFVVNFSTTGDGCKIQVLNVANLQIPHSIDADAPNGIFFSQLNGVNAPFAETLEFNANQPGICVAAVYHSNDYGSIVWSATPNDAEYLEVIGSDAVFGGRVSIAVKHMPYSSPKLSSISIAPYNYSYTTAMRKVGLVNFFM